MAWVAGVGRAGHRVGVEVVMRAVHAGGGLVDLEDAARLLPALLRRGLVQLEDVVERVRVERVERGGMGGTA